MDICLPHTDIQHRHGLGASWLLGFLLTECLSSHRPARKPEPVSRWRRRCDDAAAVPAACRRRPTSGVVFELHTTPSAASRVRRAASSVPLVCAFCCLTNQSPSLTPSPSCLAGTSPPPSRSRNAVSSAKLRSHRCSNAVPSHHPERLELRPPRRVQRAVSVRRPLVREPFPEPHALLLVPRRHLAAPLALAERRQQREVALPPLSSTCYVAARSRRKK